MSGKKGFFAMFRNPHYRMERFGAMVLFFVFVMGIIFSICLKRQHDSKQLNLGIQAQYTVSTQFSLTGEMVDVSGVWRDSGLTKCFVLLHTESMKNLPTEASKYEMFLTSYDSKKKLTCNPKGAIYVFGNTGYVGLYFHDDAGFENNLYDVVVRNWDMVAEGNVELAQSIYGDESFWHFNQIQFYANFAGTGAPVAGFLENGSFTPEDIYTELVLESDSGSIRDRLNQDLYTMNQAMAVINTYRDRLDSYGMVVPEVPVSIAGDCIVGNPELTESNPSAFDASMLTNRSGVSDNYDVSIDASDESYADGDRLYLVTDYVFPGGIQYNYQDVKIADHVLDDLKPEELTYSQWLTSKSVESKTYSIPEPTFSWKYKDGRAFVADENKKSEAIAVDIANYETAVKTMVSTKKSFQTSDLYSLLQVDDSNRGLSDLFSVAAEDNTLILY